MYYTCIKAIRWTFSVLILTRPLHIVRMWLINSLIFKDDDDEIQRDFENNTFFIRIEIFHRP